MAAHRFWRLVGFELDADGPLELSEIRLYAAGVLADIGAALTSSLVPMSGALSALTDGLTSAVVSWAHAQYIQPGFSLLWDMGGAIAVDGLQVGAGANASTYPRSVIVQWSDDGASWTTYRILQSIKYPGSFSITAFMDSAGVDAFSDSVVLKLECAGENNSTTLQDGSPNPITVTPLGGAKISSAVSRNNSSSLVLTGGATLSVAPAPGLDLSNGDFTVELYVYKTDTRAVFILDKDGAAGLRYPQWSLLCVGGKLQARIGTGSIAGYQVFTSATDIPLNQWAHLAFTRSANTLRLFVDGAPDGAGTATQAVQMMDAGYPLIIGNEQGQADWFAGYMDDIRITKGVARYTTAFTPPARLGSALQMVETDASLKLECWRTSLARIDTVSGESHPVGAAYTHTAEHTFFDAYHGGRGVIRSTVKQKDTPTNTPLRRRVDLIDERSRLTIRETWSDAATGNYEFRGIRADLVYSVVAWDYLHNYRAEMADNLMLSNGGVELMP